MKRQTELQVISCIVGRGVLLEIKECDVSVDSQEKCSIDFHIVSEITTVYFLLEVLAVIIRIFRMDSQKHHSFQQSQNPIAKQGSMPKFCAQIYRELVPK